MVLCAAGVCGRGLVQDLIFLFYMLRGAMLESGQAMQA